MWVNKQLTYHWLPQYFFPYLPTFFKISSFGFRRRKKLIQVWNNAWESKPNRWVIKQLIVAIDFHCIISPYYRSQWLPSTIWLPTFFKISSFGLMLAIDFHSILFPYHGSLWLTSTFWLPTFFKISSFWLMVPIDFHSTFFPPYHGSQWLTSTFWLPTFFQISYFWLMVPIDFHSIFSPHIIEVNGYRQLFGYPHSSKYLLLGSAEEKLIQVCNNMRVSKWWQNCHFGWTFPLSCMKVMMLDSNKNSSSSFECKNPIK